MARVLVLGIVALASGSACGQTERDPPGLFVEGGTAPGGAGSGQLAGMAGSGGPSPELSAVDECVRYCETLDYRLPHALCEDWHLPEWDPEFCGVDFGMSCADYCGNVYETVSPACAVVLAPAIRCVSFTYARINVPSAGECLFENCRELLYTMTSACYGLREKLAAGRAAWEASGVVEYQLQYDWGSNVKAQVLVRVGSEPAVMPPDATPWTVPKLFDEVERYLDTPGVAPSATYHPDLGFVVYLARHQGCAEPSEGVSGIEVAPLR